MSTIEARTALPWVVLESSAILAASRSFTLSAASAYGNLARSAGVVDSIEGGVESILVDISAGGVSTLVPASGGGDGGVAGVGGFGTADSLVAVDGGAAGAGVSAFLVRVPGTGSAF